MYKLNIVPLKEPHCNCVENIFVTILQNMNKKYHFLLSESWGFSYQRSDTEKLLGERLSSGESSVFDLMDIHYGVSITINDIKPGEHDAAYTKILNELSKGLPVLIVMDAFWDPSTQHTGLFGKAHHYGHMRIVTDIDVESRSLYYYALAHTDPPNQFTLSYDSFVNGCTNIITLSFSNTPPTPSWKDITRTSLIKNRLAPNEMDSAFNDMKNFAHDIINVLDVHLEFKDHELIWSAPIKNRLDSIAAGRFKFYRFLHTIGEDHGIDEICNISYQVHQSGKNWALISDLILKMHFAKNDSLKEKIANAVLENAEFEANIANQLFYKCLNNAT